MNTLLKILSTSLLALALVTSAAAGTTELKLDKNGKIDFSAYKGKVVYLDFWASWCEPCRQSFVWMNKIHDEYDKKDFVIIAVNLDSEKHLADAFLKQVPAKFNIAYDPSGATAEAYELKGMPSSFLIDKKGRIAMAKVGFKHSDSEKLESSIEKLIGK